MTFIPIMYSMISYIFLKLGIKVIPSQNKLWMRIIEERKDLKDEDFVYAWV
jgi:hypothetical protein